MKTTGKVTGIVSNLVTVQVDGPVAENELCYITLDGTPLLAEVIQVAGQEYADTQGQQQGQHDDRNGGDKKPCRRFESHLSVRFAIGLASYVFFSVFGARNRMSQDFVLCFTDYCSGICCCFSEETASLWWPSCWPSCRSFHLVCRKRMSLWTISLQSCTTCL